jgi:hypothetical protein
MPLKNLMTEAAGTKLSLILVRGLVLVHPLLEVGDKLKKLKWYKVPS